ncbi:saccharopine dehydrogenase-like oxidoreductase [Saccoglossus kowalevskii]|uniref:Saccharopine dehydrogenase-like oxidoreductase-like n=1 Tax=Saccoglossus kowalevskii TaxID=10224 RepID=A0ABM0GLG6_SACKO|nr:PREDICTED: saccharopine dehydrogenase-like oxidoreductase-like [Saccoglossus kowalevskii]
MIMAAPVERKFDVVIFGASGFTGQFVVEELARVADEERDIKWAIAGRSKGKLNDVLKQAESVTGYSLSNIDVIIADVADEESLESMCKQTKLVLNCVGPYRFWGEQVVKSCVENGCHHIDISGEPQFLETMQLKYDSKARENSVFVIGTCGFDSVPADIGTNFIQQQFPGELNSVESYVTFNNGPKGGGLHYGTWLSAIHGLGDQQNLRKIRKQINPEPMPKMKPTLQRRGAVFHSSDMNKWCIPFLGADAAVVRRTQRYQHEKRNKRPIQYGAYLALPNIFALIGLMLFGLIFIIMTKFRLGMYLLAKYPRLFSAGMCSHEGPSREQMKGSSFSMTFFGQGFNKDSSNKDQNDMKMVTKVTGPEPGYITTPIAMVQCAVTVLKEPQSLPQCGGVFTPGTMFMDTKIIERLNNHGIKFTVVGDAK